MKPRTVMTAALVMAIVLGGGALARPFVMGLAFVVRAANLSGAAQRIAALGTSRFSEQSVSITASGGRSFAGRLYRPEGGVRRTTLLVSGLHPAGIDEPRLVALAREMAASGIAVLTPAIPDLEQFTITPRLTDDVESAAEWLLKQSVVQDQYIGLIGISFSGGLSIVAAGRPSIRNNISYVVSVGGHDDLPRVLRYLCTGTEPYPRQMGERSEPFVRAPHDYGVAIILLGVADRIVPPAQVDALKAAARLFLDASALDGVDREASAREFQEVKQRAETMPEPSATLVKYMSDRDVVHLGTRLLPFIGLYGEAPALSVSRSPKPSAPVFLLHGTEDNVIPTIEADYLADDLRAHTTVHLLLSDLISHVGVDRPPHVSDVLRLADFWGDILTR